LALRSALKQPERERRPKESKKKGLDLLGLLWSNIGFSMSYGEYK
jgi:hypothetical protein